MKNRVSGIVVVLMLISVLWTSCSKDDTENYEYVPDVFLVNQIMNNDTVHALTYYVFSNTEMANATVVRSDDPNNEIEMSPYENSPFVMIFEPSDNDYTTEPESAGMFLFTIESDNGITVQDSDYFDPQKLTVPKITELSYSLENNLIVKWADVDDAQVYLVKVIDPDGTTIYMSNQMGSATNQVTLDSSHGTWSDQPEVGVSYTVQLHAIVYESGVNALNAAYNVEEISIGKKTIVWE